MGHRTIWAALLALAGLLGAGSAHAGGNVYWSVGIHAPLDPFGASIGTTISNAPRVVYRPAPVYLAPAPVYMAPPPPVYYPAPVYYKPAPRVVYVQRPAPVYVMHKHHPHKHWKHHHRQHRHHDHDD